MLSLRYAIADTKHVRIFATEVQFVDILRRNVLVHDWARLLHGGLTELLLLHLLQHLGDVFVGGLNLVDDSWSVSANRA